MLIRTATADDAPLILELIRELATFERAPEAVHATVGDLLRDGFGDQPRFHVLLAGEGAVILGFAFYFFAYSTWEGRPVMYLEDLFVRPEHRGRGAGLALMRRVAKEALAARCTRFQWQVLDWNTDAIGFYERLGAEVLREWQAVRITGDALAKLAAQD